MVTIIKQSGKPIDEGEAEKFMEEWKDGFDKLFGRLTCFSILYFFSNSSSNSLAFSVTTAMSPFASKMLSKPSFHSSKNFLVSSSSTGFPDCLMIVTILYLL